MPLRLKPYLMQSEQWPRTGRHILAQYDDNSIVVYQAFDHSIGNYAVKHGLLGGGFRLTRTSWIKPNFLWMMYRSGWGTKENQNVVLAIRIQRSAFDTLLAHAIQTTFASDIYGSESAWATARDQSDVLVQWDPDHDPAGAKTERRAIQLGVRGDTLARYARNWICEIEDVSDFVRQQRQYAHHERYGQLETPHEEPYPVNDATIARRLGVAPG